MVSKMARDHASPLLMFPAPSEQTCRKLQQDQEAAKQYCER